METPKRYWHGPSTIAPKLKLSLDQLGLVRIIDEIPDKSSCIVIYPALESLVTNGLEHLDCILQSYMLSQQEYVTCCEWRLSKLSHDSLKNWLDSGIIEPCLDKIAHPPVLPPVYTALIREIYMCSPELQQAYCFLENNSIRFGNDPDNNFITRTSSCLTVVELINDWNLNYYQGNRGLRDELDLAYFHLKHAEDECVSLDSAIIERDMLCSQQKNQIAASRKLLKESLALIEKLVNRLSVLSTAITRP